MSDQPTFAELLPRVRELYATPHGAVGGCLHIVLDDGNIENRSVEWCIEYARVYETDEDPYVDAPYRQIWPPDLRGHELCEPLARDLLRASMRTRERLYHDQAKHEGQDLLPAPILPEHLKDDLWTELDRDEFDEPIPRGMVFEGTPFDFDGDEWDDDGEAEPCVPVECPPEVEHR